MSKTWTVEIEEDGVLPLPDDLLEAADMSVGDELEWINNGDGTWTMQRVKDHLDDTAPRSLIEPRKKSSEPAVMSLTVAQIRDLYNQIHSLDDETDVDFYVDRSNGIGPVITARWSAEMDLTDTERW